ncbi:MAG: tRNA (adenosine(37)-N6)-dimethylallyltransferase MiaA [Saprospiraceae bacterium]
MKSSHPKTIIAIGGPTGVGKTDLAIELAKHLKCEIINADSRQVYRELHIGVNKPNQDQMSSIPHHLIGHISIHDKYNAGMFESDALIVIEELFKTNDFIILTGGTGLYLKAVLQGLDEFPGISEEIKLKVDELYQTKGLAGLQHQVRQIDPAYFKSADQKNPRRLSRALEIFYSTGKPYSQLRNNQLKKRPFNYLPVFITDERQEVYEKIDLRVDHMIREGLKNEVETLLPFRHLKSLETVGYREWWDHFDGLIDESQVIEKIKQHTRNYAKRQWTWWKPLLWPSFKPTELERLKIHLAQALSNKA